MRTCTIMMVFGLVFQVSTAVAAGQSAMGGYRAAVTPDNRLRYTLESAEFTFTRISRADTRETEMTIAGSTEAAVIIRFGGSTGLTVERGGQVVVLGSRDDSGEAAAALLTGRAVRAFRRVVGGYERDLLNDTVGVPADISPFAYSLLLSAAFVGELAGDPNALDRTRDLIRRRITARLRSAAWQQRDCVTEYERALLANDTRNTECNEAADSLDSVFARAAERLLCASEFLAGAMSAEAQFVACSGLAPLKIQ
jgi:hypothetical protein